MPAAVILAGGRGERLGGALKSELIVGGGRLLDRVAARLAECEPLLVSHGRHDAGLLRLGPGMVAVADLEGEYGGPLAGVCAAVDWLQRSGARGGLLVTVAVDTPFLPLNYVERLVGALVGGAAAAVAAHGGQVYPTNAIWRLDALEELPERVRRGTAPHSPKRLAAELGAKIADWSAGNAPNPFANVNTPEELEEMRRRAIAGAARFD